MSKTNLTCPPCWTILSIAVWIAMLHVPSIAVGPIENCPQITIQALTNDREANTPPGPLVALGRPVVWQYIVTNVGEASLVNVTVIDDQGVFVACGGTTLEPGESLDCTAEGVATQGQYANVATVTATAPNVGAVVVEASDPSHYFGARASIIIETHVRESAADAPPGPIVLANDPLEWRHVLTNDGNITLDNIVVSRGMGQAVECPSTSLEPGASMTCVASMAADVGQMRNTAYVFATGPEHLATADQDTAYAFGAAPSLHIEKHTLGQDADQPPGVYAVAGRSVEWTYEVINTGNIRLENVAVSDAQGGGDICTGMVLQPRESVMCFSAGITAAGQHGGTASATGTLPGLAIVSDEDPSYYFGVVPGIDVEMLTNGEDADEPPGPYILPGQPVTRTYRVSNNCNDTVTQITVTDLDGIPVSCPGTTLFAGASMECDATTTPRHGQRRSGAIVTGYLPGGLPAGIAVDASHYFGAMPLISIDYLHNGLDADQPPGPALYVGTMLTKTFLVRNIGNVPLTGVSVTDSQAGSVTCLQSTLDPGESMSCEVLGAVEVGQHASLATVGAMYNGAVPVTAGDTSHYVGIPACLHDCDGDGDIDLLDYADFQVEWSGPR